MHQRTAAQKSAKWGEAASSQPVVAVVVPCRAGAGGAAFLGWITPDPELRHILEQENARTHTQHICLQDLTERRQQTSPRA